MNDKLKDKFKDLPDRVKIVIFLIGLILILKCIIFPLSDYKAKNLALTETLKKKILTMENLLLSRDKIESGFEQIKITGTSVENRFYTKFSDPQQLQLNLQKKLEEIAAKEKVKIVNTRWATALEGKLVYAPVKIICEARPENLYKMIYEIEHDLKFICIDRSLIKSNRRKNIVVADMVIAAWGLNKE